jgi:hypothetical protein
LNSTPVTKQKQSPTLKTHAPFIAKNAWPLYGILRELRRNPAIGSCARNSNPATEASFSTLWQSQPPTTNHEKTLYISKNSTNITQNVQSLNAKGGKPAISANARLK